MILLQILILRRNGEGAMRVDISEFSDINRLKTEIFTKGKHNFLAINSENIDGINLIIIFRIVHYVTITLIA